MNELERLVELSKFNLDYTCPDTDLGDLVFLAARICGAEISLVNLIDRYNQWTVARYGTDIKQMSRKDSVCQFTIEQDGPLELKSLKSDPRFKDKDYVCGGPKLDYYYGIPLRTDSGAKIGTLAVLDKQDLGLSEDQSALLKTVADLVVSRLDSIKRTRQLEEWLDEANRSKRKVGHDVRGPISGIIGLVDLLKEEFKEREITEWDEILGMMEKSAETVLELTDSILNESIRSDADYTCQILAEKLEQLYAPQASSKKVKLSVDYDDSSGEATHFPPKALLQIGGNLINNAIKFTREGNTVSVRIHVEENQEALSKDLLLKVEDNGTGMPKERIDKIRQGHAESELGTEGERGFGLGLPLVRQLVENEKGSLKIRSKQGEGCEFTVRLPIE